VTGTATGTMTGPRTGTATGTVTVTGTGTGTGTVTGTGRISVAAWIICLLLVKIAFPPFTCYPAKRQAKSVQCVSKPTLIGVFILLNICFSDLSSTSLHEYMSDVNTV
jgi:hypothetical protein